jgi:hypothetical protein
MEYQVSYRKSPTRTSPFPEIRQGIPETVVIRSDGPSTRLQPSPGEPMENRSSLGPLLIACGTLLVVAALALAGYQMSLSAADVRDHRTQASGLLRDSNVEKVTLSEWEPPSTAIAWVALAGGFVLIASGIRKASLPPDVAKRPARRDDLE